MKEFIKRNGIYIVFGVILLVMRVLDYDFFSHPLLSLKSMFTQMLYIIPGIIIGITVHEFAHAFVAYKLGDQTPKIQKRVSLNPYRHVDPIGFVALLIIGFGWGKPVQVNPYAFKHPRRDNLLTDVAGVITNFIIAFIFTGLASLILKNLGTQMYTIGPGFYMAVSQVLTYMIYMNLVLMIFNLLPVPPLDGFGIITEIFNLRGKPIYTQIYNMGFPILMVLIIFRIPSKVISPIIEAIFSFMMGVFF
jgi:Zn-dependent protease